MARLGKTLLFEKSVRDALLEHLPEGFCADPNRHPRAVRTTEWGEQYLWVSLTKGHLNLSYGVIFRAFAEVDRIANGPPRPGWQERAFSMTSMNMRQMKGLPYVKRFPLRLLVVGETTDEGWWRCYESKEPPARIAQRMIGFLRGVASPFFERFSSLEAVRESLVQDDGWLMGSRCEDILLIDIALNDKTHFHDYVQAKREDQNFAMALKKVPTLIERFPHFALEAQNVEPGASPNGGPAEALDNSGGGGGPPSVR